MSNVKKTEGGAHGHGYSMQLPRKQQPERTTLLAVGTMTPFRESKATTSKYQWSRLPVQLSKLASAVTASASKRLPVLPP